MKNIKKILLFISSILLILSALAYTAEWSFVPYIYAVSGAGVAVYFLTTTYRGDNFRIKRLNIQQTIAAVMFPLSSFLMFKKRNEWYICLLVAAILIIYIIFIREYEEKKEKKMDGKDQQQSK
ncbi:MAG: hypothetical protein LBH32_01655 [Dysgonamonadaceae bacterium]|jgi:hypothetical protein|nr:hypothetical protein [Dysgonamonadaceae bacterium]